MTGSLISAMEVQRIFILLVDISGYTKFIRYHKTSLLHAEKIVTELMEAILAEVQLPVMAHEILGDAISLYALDEGIPGQPNQIYEQLLQYFEAFWQREASLISACKLCQCDACLQVGQLKLKAILHVGAAAFTQIFNTRKISGEDVIIAHRLLKNSVPSDEYILMTSAFAERCTSLNKKELTLCVERCEGIGQVTTYYHEFAQNTTESHSISMKSRLRDFLKIEGYMVRRWFRDCRYRFRNLPEIGLTSSLSDTTM